MDSAPPGQNQISEATRLLKEILNVGPSTSTELGAGQFTDSRPSTMNHQMNGAGDGPVTDSACSVEDMLRQEIGTRMPQQQVTFRGDDDCDSFSIYGRQVTVVTSSESTQSVAGSNKVKISPIVNYDWENKYYHGNLVAVHRQGIYVAYALKGRTGGIVRIISRQTADRALIKGFDGSIVDLAFAHLNVVVIGVVDDLGSFAVYEIIEGEGGKIEPRMLLHVNRPGGGISGKVHRLIWCPYISDDEDSSGTTVTDNSVTEDFSKLLVLMHDEVAEMWNVDHVIRHCGKGPHDLSEVEEGFVAIRSHTQPILDATFSPDGSALATAGMDGDVKFFQAQIGDLEPPRCLHQWQPHDGKPVNFLGFLDDHKQPSPDVQFWKFAVTGGNYNQQIRVWSCESWTCLQSIEFTPSPSSSLTAEPGLLKARLDLTANYIILTDIKQKVLYVLQMHQDLEANTALVCSASEFLLTLPCLSFDVLDAGRRKLRKSQDQDQENLGDITTGEIENDEEEDVPPDVEGPDIGVLVKLVCVHTKALQELQIRYQPESSVPHPPPHSISSVSQDDIPLRDGLSDMSMDVGMSDGDGRLSDRSRHSDQSLHASSKSTHSAESLPQPLLMTPDAFTASSPRRPDAHQMGDHLHSSSSSSFTQVTAMNEDLMTPHESVKQQDSPVSSLTLTPASSHDMSHGSPHLTPTSAPGRLGTLSEDVGDQASSQELSQMFDTAVSQTLPVAASTGKGTGAARPASEGERSTSVEYCMDRGTGYSRRALLRSTGSSSSTSLEVSEILGEASKQVQSQVYEDTQADELDEQEKISPRPDQSQEEEQKIPEEEGVVPEGQLVDLGQTTVLPKSAWPEPPNVEKVNAEAERLASEAIQRAAALHEAQKEQEAETVDGSGSIQAEDQSQEEELEQPQLLLADQRLHSNQWLASAATSDQPESSSTSSSPRQPHRYIHRSRPKTSTTPPGVQAVDTQRLDQLQKSVEHLQSLVQQQQQCVTSDLHSINSHQQQQQDRLQQLQDRLDMMEGSLTAKLSGALDQHSSMQSRHLQTALKEKDSQEKQKHDRLLAVLQQSVNSSVAQQVDRTVKQEVKHTLVPNMTSVLQPLKDQLHLEMAQKLTATDTLMRENISKLVRSRQTIESIGQAAAASLQGPIQASYRDAFQSIVVPAFERACQNLFHQVNESFQRGTKEYVQQLENHLEQIRRRQDESRDPIVQQMCHLVDQFKHSSEQIQSDIVNTVKHELDTRVQSYMSSVQDSLSTNIRDIVKDELATAMKEQQTSISDSLMNAVRASALTPAATPVHMAGLTDSREMQQNQLLQLLRQGQLNTAFQQALSAANLELVIFVCENVNPAQVFNQMPCPLQQPVLLSLIQQLSADLVTATDLKHKFLEEAVMNLDTSNTLTREHMPSVLGSLCQKLMAFIQAHPQESRNMRMLLMAAKSLLR